MNNTHQFVKGDLVYQENGSFWVIERFENQKSKGYWFGNSSREFSTNIDEAIQFSRKKDASRILLTWHWEDCQVTEHKYLQPLSPEGAIEPSGYQPTREQLEWWANAAKDAWWWRDKNAEQLKIAESALAAKDEEIAELRHARQLVVEDLSEALEAGVEFDEQLGVYKNVRAEKAEAELNSLRGEREK